MKEGGGITPKRVPEGDYLAKILKVTEEVSQNDNEMWVYVLELVKRRGCRYPYHCTLTKESLWKLYNLFVAAGKKVPKKRVNVDRESILGELIGITLVDDEYEGREKSTIDAVFPAEDLDDENSSLDDEEIDEEEEALPAQKTRSRTAASKRSASKTTTTRRRGNKRAAVDDDVTDDEMEELDVDDEDEDLEEL
ncbi:MAG: hypothetical protein ACRDSF_00195 [Pseudonocardiaceae bacterium]